MIEQLVCDLPEVYQPIYGYPSLSHQASRTCKDRLAHIVGIHDKLSDLLGRPLKMLDLGCAQGFFCFNLAKRGAIVHGVDYLDKNIALCNALADDNAHLSISFETGRVEDVIERLELGDYDLVLGLSVFHHIIHEKGIEIVKKLLEHVANLSGGLIVELALKEEPLYWGSSQPKDPQTLLDTIAFVNELARHATHLASIPRPLFVASNRYWILDDEVSAFENWSMEPHTLAHGTHKGSRRYFFSTTCVLKMYRFDHSRGAYNKSEFTREVQFLQNPPAEFAVPELIEYGKNERGAWLVQQRISGRVLLDLLQEGVAIDHHAVVLAVLAQLTTLEKAGFYHSDLRIWNILVTEDGTIHLIDYGSFSTKKQDCSWPRNLFLSFLIFVREVSTRSVDLPEPLRTVSISPYGLPEPYRTWATSLWHRPMNEWSFGLMYETLLETPAIKQKEQYPLPVEVWMNAMEESIQTLKHFAVRQAHQASERADQAEAQAVQASERAGQAEVQAAQASERAGRAEAQAVQACKGAGQAEVAAHNARMQYQAVINSHTWRMTWPIRYFGNAAKRFVRGVIAWFTFKPGSCPQRTARRLLLVANNKVSQYPSLKRFILTVLRIVLGKNAKDKIAFFLVMGDNLASKKLIEKPKSIFEDYLQFALQPEFSLIFSYQNEIEQKNYREILSKKCGLSVDHQFIRALRECESITLKKPLMNEHFNDIKQIIVHMYLAFLRRYPSDLEAAIKVNNLIKTQSIMKEIQSIKASKEFKTLGYFRLNNDIS